MLPYNSSFRKMLRRYIPQVSEQQLRRHEELLGLRQELINESAYAGENDFGSYLESVQVLSNGATEIFAGFEHLYEATEKVWEARRRFAYKQGNLQQIPGSFGELRGFVRAGWQYTATTWRYLPVLWWNRIRVIMPIIPDPRGNFDPPGTINPDDGREPRGDDIDYGRGPK